MFNELDVIVLAHDIPAYNLTAGTTGAIVNIARDGLFEVEFVNSNGQTVALLTLNENDVRPIQASTKFQHFSVIFSPKSDTDSFDQYWGQEIKVFKPKRRNDLTNYYYA